MAETLGDFEADRQSDRAVAAELLETGGESREVGAPAPDDVHEWLLQLYPEHVTEAMGPHHADAWEWVESIEDVDEPVDPFVGVWSRGGAKSSTAELATVRVGLTDRRRYAWYVRGTQDQADKSLANIAALLEAEGVEVHYPKHADRMLSKYGHSRGWNVSRLRTRGGFTVDAIGLDTAQRGLKVEADRPDWIVLDDLDAKHDSELTTKKKLATLTHSVLPAGTPRTAVLAIQNLIIPDGIFSRLADGRADFLARRRVSGPVPALHEMTIDTEQTSEGFLRALVGGKPTWTGQSVAACQALMDLIGLTAFRLECQHEVTVREGALWTEDDFVRWAKEIPGLVRIAVGVDPSGGTDAIGIIVAGIDRQGRIYILADWTQPGSLGVDNWAGKVYAAYEEFKAGRIVAEKNFGGDMVEAVIRAAADGDHLPVRLVTASRGKHVRAEPVAELYKKRRVVHCDAFPELEAELTGWVPGDPRSPNRLDALVWVVTDLAFPKRRKVEAFVPGQTDVKPETVGAA